MDGNTKIYFRLETGYVGADYEEEFTLADLGYDSEVNKDLDDFLNEAWSEWAFNCIEGGWAFDRS